MPEILQEIKENIDEIRTGLADRIATVEAKVDDLRSEIPGPEPSGVSKSEIEDKIRALTEPLVSRMDAMEARQQDPTADGRPVSDLGAALADDPEIQRWLSVRRGSAMAQVPSLSRAMVGGWMTRAVDVMAGGELGATAVPEWRPGVAPFLTRPPRLLDLLPRVEITSDVYHCIRYTKESSEGYVTTFSTNAVNGSSSAVSDLVVDNVEGFVPGQIVRIYTTSQTKELTLQSVDIANKKLVFSTSAINFDIAAGDRVASDVFAATAEEGQLPAGYVETEDLAVTLRTLGSTVDISEQRINSAADLASAIEGQLKERFRKVLEWHIIYGDATSSQKQLTGWANDSGLTEVKWSAQPTGSPRATAVLAGAATIPWDGLIGVVMSKTDWEAIKTSVGSDGHYVHTGYGPVSVVDRPGYRALGSLLVVLSPAIKAGECFAFAPEASSEVVAQPAADVQWGYVDANFRKSIITGRYTEMVGNAIIHSNGFAKVSFDSAP